MASKKFKQAVSPIGTLSWPWLTKPDTRYNAEGVYKTSLIVNDVDAKPLMDLCTEVFIAEFGQAKLKKAVMPFDEELDANGNPTGNIVFKFKSKRAPGLFDAKAKPIAKTLNVASGTTAKIATALNPYATGVNTGVSMYLNDVQILELVEYGANAANKFQQEDGFEFVDDGKADLVAVEPSVAEDGDF
jgi:hypothetical protein